MSSTTTTGLDNDNGSNHHHHHHQTQQQQGLDTCQTRLELWVFSFFLHQHQVRRTANTMVPPAPHNDIASHDGHDGQHPPSIVVLFIYLLILFKSLAFKNNDDDSPLPGDIRFIYFSLAGFTPWQGRILFFFPFILALSKCIAVATNKNSFLT